MLAVLALLACGGSATLTPGQEGCIDYDFQDPDPSTLETSVGVDGSAQVWRTNVVTTGEYFEPEIVANGALIEVHEAWTGGDGATEACWNPLLDVEGLSSKLEVRWFGDDGSDVPFDTVFLEP